MKQLKWACAQGGIFCLWSFLGWVPSVLQLKTQRTDELHNWASSVWTRVWVDLLLRQCNTDTHTHSLMTADNYARSAITAAGIRLAQKLIICLDGRGRYASSNLGHKWKENTDCFHRPRDSSSMLCESESGIVQRDPQRCENTGKTFVPVYSLNS